MIALFDLEKAYDKVCRAGLLLKLAGRRFPVDHKVGGGLVDGQKVQSKDGCRDIGMAAGGRRSSAENFFVAMSIQCICE